jgi:hypothetical protein
MNGFSLLLAFAGLSVVYSWRTGVDQQQEYVLQIEPEIVQALITGGPRGEGEEIFSDIPPDAGPFHRLCISILPKDGIPARHTAAAEDQFRQLILSAGRYASRTLTAADPQPSILWPGRAGGIPEQSYGVTTGWQPDANGNQQYFVQIDPTVLSTLAIGDELYVPIEPAAGRPVRFVVKSGRGTLPRAGSQQTSLGQMPPSNVQPIGTNNRGANGWTNSTAPDLLRDRPRVSGGYSDLPGVDPRTNQYTSPQTTGLQNPPPNYGNPPPPVNNYDQYRSDQYRNTLPPLAEAPPPNYGVQPVSNQPPQLPPPQRPWNQQYPEPRVAGLPPTQFGATTPGPLNNGVFPTSGVPRDQDKPWGPLLFVTFALFFSIGGNLYLAYTALEFHSRYRNAIERLRSAARSP